MDINQKIEELKNSNVTYSEAMEELTSISRRLEKGTLPLEELLSAYERAIVLGEFCKQRIEGVKKQVLRVNQTAFGTEEVCMTDSDEK